MSQLKTFPNLVRAFRLIDDDQPHPYLEIDVTAQVADSLEADFALVESCLKAIDGKKVADVLTKSLMVEKNYNDVISYDDTVFYSLVLPCDDIAKDLAQALGISKRERARMEHVFNDFFDGGLFEQFSKKRK